MHCCISWQTCENAFMPGTVCSYKHTPHVHPTTTHSLLPPASVPSAKLYILGLPRSPKTHEAVLKAPSQQRPICFNCCLSTVPCLALFYFYRELLGTWRYRKGKGEKSRIGQDSGCSLHQPKVTKTPSFYPLFLSRVQSPSHYWREKNLIRTLDSEVPV